MDSGCLAQPARPLTDTANDLLEYKVANMMAYLEVLATVLSPCLFSKSRFQCNASMSLVRQSSLRRHISYASLGVPLPRPEASLTLAPFCLLLRHWETDLFG